MKPSPPADKRTLIRRATYDLDRPAAHAEGSRRTFVDDKSPDAFAKVVDRLLASPQYGERWGRYLAGHRPLRGHQGRRQCQGGRPLIPTPGLIAITSSAPSTTTSLTTDFVLEQIAADRLPAGQDQRSLAALGFLTLGRAFQ